MDFTQLRYANHSGKVNLQTASSLYSCIVLVNQDNQLMEHFLPFTVSACLKKYIIFSGCLV